MSSLSMFLAVLPAAFFSERNRRRKKRQRERINQVMTLTSEKEMREIWYNYHICHWQKKNSHIHMDYIIGWFSCRVISCFILKVFPSCAMSYCPTSLFFSRLLRLRSCVPLVFCLSSPIYVFKSAWFSLWLPVCCVPLCSHILPF